MNKDQPSPRRPRPERREVYFIEGAVTRLIKIGVADYATERLKELQVGSPDKLILLGVLPIPAGHIMETILHGKFRHACSHGEWHHPVPELLAYIADHAQKPREARKLSLSERAERNARRRRTRHEKQAPVLPERRQQVAREARAARAAKESEHLEQMREVMRAARRKSSSVTA